MLSYSYNNFKKESDRMFCSQCGTRLPDGVAVCTACNTPVHSRIKAPSAPQTPPPAVQRPSCPQRPVYLPYQQSWPNVRSAPVAPAKAVKPPKTKKEHRPLTPPSGGKKAGTVILCIFMVLFLILSSLLGVVRDLFTEDALEDILEDVSFSDLSFVNANGEENTLADAINDSVVTQTSDNVTNVVGQIPYGEYVPDYVTDSAMGYITDYVKLNDRDIDDIFSIDEVREFIIDTILGYTDCIIYGRRLHTVTAEDIAEFICDHQELIKEEIDKEIYFDYDVMVSEMNHYFDFSAIEDKDAIEEAIGFSLSPITFVFSTAYYILLALAVIFFALIIVINFKNLPACMTKVGVSSIVFAVFMLLIGIGMLLSGSIFSGLAFAPAITAICSHIASYFLVSGGIALVFGLALIFVRKLWLKPRFEK